MHDFREALAKLQEQFNINESTTVNTIDLVEEVNPNLTKESSAYKDNKKFIFKGSMSYENAQEIVEAISTTDLRIYEYREKVTKVCHSAWIMGESPVEMMIYATKSLEGKEEYLGVVLDVLKTLYEKDQSFTNYYYNILRNWNWTECVKVVLKSLQDFRLQELSQPVYRIFETNEILREEAALTLIAMGETQYFESIINFLVTRKNDTRVQLDEIRTIMIAMGSVSEEASYLIYRNYMERSLRTDVANQMIPGVRRNFSARILQQAEKILNNKHAERSAHKKVMRLLERCNSNPVVGKLYDQYKRCDYLQHALVSRQSEVTDVQSIIELAKQKGAEHPETLNALLNLGKLSDEQSEKVLRTFKEKTDLLDIYASSALIERGGKNEIVTLSIYLVAPGKDDKVVREAINQLRRLRRLQNSSINTDIFKITTRLLEKSVAAQNTTHIMRILSLYETGIPNDEIGRMYLSQLETSTNTVVQDMSLKFLVRNHSQFGPALQREVHEVMIAKSKEGTAFSKEVMSALSKISSKADAVPVAIRMEA